MTAPQTGATVRPFDENIDGLASPAAAAEWEAVKKMRDDAMDESLARQGIVSSNSKVIDDWLSQLTDNPTAWLDPHIVEQNKAQVQSTDPLAELTPGLQPRAAHGLMSMLFPNATIDPNNNESRDKLLDVAKAWNIPGASEMPQDMLQAAIDARRADVVRPADIGALGWIEGQLGGLGRGIGEALGEATKNIPYFGESMNKLVHSDAAAKWTAMMTDAGKTNPIVGVGGLIGQALGIDAGAMRTQQEHFEAGLPAQYVPYARFENKLGYGIGYAAPSIASWEAMGALGASKFVAGWGNMLSPISRAVVRGSTAMWLQRGGAKADPNELLGETILGGAFAGFGTIMADMFPGRQALADKAAEAFHAAPNDGPPLSSEEQWAREDAARLAGNTRTSAMVVNVHNPSDPFEPDFIVHDQPSPVRASIGGPDFGGAGTVSEGPGVQPSNPNAIVRYGSNVGDGGAIPDVPPSAPSAPVSPVRALGGLTSPVHDILDYPHAPYRPIVPTSPLARFLPGTHVADAFGNPIRVYHGTGTDFESHDPTKSSPTALWGDGIYYTEDPYIAGGSGDPKSTLGYAFGNGTPQVRAAYLDIKKPFRLDDVPDDFHEFVDQFADANPGVDVSEVHDTLDQWDERMDMVSGKNLTNNEVHIALQTARPAMTPDIDVQKLDLLTGYPRSIGRNGVNEGLRNMGYDGLTHVGGNLTGNDPHRVWIAWEPTQVHPAWLAHSTADDGIAMTKQDIVQRSELSPALAKQAVLSNVDVARAAVASNSGGINVIADIGNLGQTVQDMALATHGGSPLQYRFGLHPSGRVDLLVSDVNIPDKAVEEYQQHGMFTGQSVITASGRAGYISKLTDTKVTVKNPYSGSRAVTLRKSSVFPRSGSEAYVEAPEAWAAFKDYAGRYIAQESAKGELPAPGIFDPQYTQMLPDVLDTWLAKQGFDSPTVAALQQYFGVRRVEEYKALAPKEYDLMDSIGHDADKAETTADELRPPTLTQKAATRGFFWAQTPAFPGGQLWDMNSSLKMAFDSDEEAEAFLKNLDREVPDHTPGGDVPAELADVIQGSVIEASGTVDDAERALDSEAGAPHIFGPVGSLPPEIVDALEPQLQGGPPMDFGGGGSNLPPGGPPPELLGGKPDFSGEFNRISHPQLWDLVNKYNGNLTQWFRNTRSTFQHMEEDLTGLGVDFHPWRYYQNVEAGMKQMESEAQPWQVRASQILGQARQLILRNGEFTRIHEIQDPITREHMMTNASWNKGDRQASEDLRALTDELYDYGRSRGLFRDGERGFIDQYLSHVQLREGMPGVENPWADNERYLPSGFNFFADNLRRGGMSARQMDPRWLMQHYIRAMHWGLHVAQPMREYLDYTQASGVPTVFKQYAANWAQVAQTGYDIQQDMAVKGLQGLVNTLGKPFNVKITPQQAAHLLNAGMTNMHWAFLGFRPHVLFRDAFQPILAMIKGDITSGIGVYKDYFSSAEIRAKMQQRALDGGWAEIGRAPVEMPSMFGAIPQSVGGAGLAQPSGESLVIPETGSILTEKQQYVHEMLAGLQDTFRDLLPTQFRTIAGRKYDPLYAYSKLGNLNRVLAGEMGYRLANKAGERLYASNMVAAGVATDEQKVLVKDLTGPMTKEQFLHESALDGFRSPVGDEAWRLVSVGDYRGAANLAGREMANETQFQYGVRNLPPKAQSITGRMGMQFGTFTNQFATTMGNGLTRGSAARRAKFLLGIGAVTLGLKKLQDETGWNFTNWIWAKAFGWMGGPMVQGFTSMLPQWSALVNTTFGGETKGENQTATEAVGGIAKIGDNLGGTLLESQNPTYGLFQESDALNRAMQSPDPFYELTGVLLTGPKAVGSGYRTMFNDMADSAASHALDFLPDTLRQHIDSIPGGGARQ